MTMNTQTNMYSVLTEKEYGFAFPAKITHLEPHPISYLVKHFIATRYINKYNRGAPKKFYSLHDSPILKERSWDVVSEINNRTSSEIYHKDNTLLESELDLLLERVKEAKAEYHSASGPCKKGQDYDDWEYAFEYYKKIYDDLKFKYDWEVEKKEGTLDQFIDRGPEFDGW